MPSTPYIISGTTYNSFGNNVSDIFVYFTVNNLTGDGISDSEGKYIFDLAELGYSEGDVVTYHAEDKFKNENYDGSFSVSGSSKSLDITLSSRLSAISVSGNRDTQVYSIGGKPISTINPFPVQVSAIPDNDGELELAYDGSGNLTTVTKTISGQTYTLTLTYDISGNLTNVSQWVKS